LTAQGDDGADGRSPTLAALDAFLGTWEIEATFGAGYFGPDSPSVTQGAGRTSFEWLDGRYFLIQRFEVENPHAPNGMAVIGLGDSPDGLVQHYFDSRGIARQYQMRVTEGVWKLWRAAPEFHQRFTGTFSDDGATISGAWEMAEDGVHWHHDFDLTYRLIK
jgi:hypothetical protein